MLNTVTQSPTLSLSPNILPSFIAALVRTRKICRPPYVSIVVLGRIIRDQPTIGIIVHRRKLGSSVCISQDLSSPGVLRRAGRRWVMFPIKLSCLVIYGYLGLQERLRCCSVLFREVSICKHLGVERKHLILFKCSSLLFFHIRMNPQPCRKWRISSRED